MAGEWIKMRTNLWSDPRVSRLCDLTGKAEATVVGALYWLWATADEHTRSGHMPGLSMAGIDRKTGIDGFGAALLAVCWIDDTEGGITLLRFDEHNGSSAKNRATTARRVARHAAGVRAATQAGGAVAPISAGDGGDPDAAAVSPALAKEEKRREDVNSFPPTPPIVSSPAKRRASGAVSLPAYLEQCKLADDKPIRADDAVFDYAAKVGVPTDFLCLQWLEFKERYSLEGAKQYKSWPTVFAKSVRGNWFRLWYIQPDGAYALTTSGLQARRQHEAGA
ncbi:hypothetical protein [Massilia antarctica]|uniref:hypothetical protein n=1 Tax=Massilia antarctica TaxID=2765360 RepID=UPI0006BB8B74|nr:hypothetical protein [Massilia sp. H27-R4]MCY0911122.1 hypothetical protein [Massilia sp. H27-R4]CUI05294.1 Primosomal protein I [Janthinobacterium sp. CG23_2]CUU29080.1 Primosomal protein I [Janthinobacterium sp. CG23_2]